MKQLRFLREKFCLIKFNKIYKPLCFRLANVARLVFSVRTLIIVISFVLVLTSFGVYAYNTNSPSTFGHTISELSPPQYCGYYDDGWLVYDGANGWTCENAPSGGSGVSTPVTCTGTNKGLQWTGSSWSCVTYSSTTPSCSWVGWDDPCGSDEEKSFGYSCTGAYAKVKSYCSAGRITSTEKVTCCPSLVR